MENSKLDILSDDQAPKGAALLAQFGGVLGIIEATLPGVVFVLVQTIFRNILISAVVTGACVLVLGIIRFAKGGTKQQLFTGVFGAAIGLVFALTSGKASNNYLPGILLNSAMIVVYAASILARWPWIGFMVGALTGDLKQWRQHRALYIATVKASWVWVALTAVRVAIMFPLYLVSMRTGDIVTIGIAKLILGLPILAIELLLTYLLVRPAYADYVSKRQATEA